MFFFAACVRLGPRWVPLRLNHQGNHAHRRAPAEPAPSHPARSIGPPPATTSACTADPRAGATSATSRAMGERPRARRQRETDSASAQPPPLPNAKPGERCLPVLEYHALCFSLALSRRSCPRPYGMHPARAHVQARWPVRPRRSAFPGASIPSPQTRTEALRQSTHP